MKKLEKILYSIVLLLQSLTIISVILIEYLTKKKAGVMHHVYFRKYEYSKIIGDEKLKYLAIIAISLAIILFILLYFIKLNKDLFYKIQISLVGILSIILSLIIRLSFFKELLAYYYFILAFISLIIIQIIWVLILSILKNFKK